jgi:hypothetical protein
VVTPLDLTATEAGLHPAVSHRRNGSPRRAHRALARHDDGRLRHARNRNRNRSWNQSWNRNQNEKRNQKQNQNRKQNQKRDRNRNRNRNRGIVPPEAAGPAGSGPTPDRVVDFPPTPKEA